LTGRIDKPYRYYEPLKGADSREYPRIDLVKTTVQRGNANYFGRYIEEAIRSIPEAHIEEAIENNEPAELLQGVQAARGGRDAGAGSFGCGGDASAWAEREHGVSLARRSTVRLGWDEVQLFGVSPLIHGRRSIL